MATTIGQLIEEEVRRQGWNITEFAEKICCTRPNVYNIFERNRMDVAQLQIISRVLDHNFFIDLAENPELADASNPEVKKDLNMEISIVMPIMKNEFEDPLPDYGLSDVAIFFTVGERLLDRFDKERLACWDIQTCVAYKNHVVDIWHNTINHMWFADVKLDYKTEEEWGEIIVYLLDSWGIPLKIRNYDNGKA